jgi:serine/threonine protein kinase
VLRIATELLSVLKYLGSLRPPVVHRDIKPENVVLEGGAWGGRVYLIDFGGVQGASPTGARAQDERCERQSHSNEAPCARMMISPLFGCHCLCSGFGPQLAHDAPHLCGVDLLPHQTAGDSLASTIVGTFGYLAPEQFR